MYTLSFQVVPGDSWGTAVLDNDTAPDTVSANQYTVILYSKYQTILNFASRLHWSCRYIVQPVFSTFEKGLQQCWFANRPVRWKGKTPQQGDKIGQAAIQEFFKPTGHWLEPGGVGKDQQTIGNRK